MKQLWTAAVLVTLAISCADDKDKTSPEKLPSGSLTINGEVKGADTGLLEILSSLDPNQNPDTIKLEGGKFTFTTTIKEPLQVAIRKPGTKGEELVFFADPGKVTIIADNDSLWKATVKAGNSQKLYKEAEDSIREIMIKGNSLYQSYMEAQQNQDQAGMQQIEKDFMVIQQEAGRFAVNFSKKHHNSVIAPFLGMMYLGQEEDKQPELKSLYDTLTLAVKGSYFGQKMAELVKRSEGTAIGSPAAAFSLPDVNGKQVALSSFKGKYLLIDFWASWCAPCRQENPNVVNAYNKFKSKGFDVLGVSLDKNKEDWTRAITQDKLSWTHVSDLKYWDNEVAKLYGVQAIPANFLLDKEGNIIGKNLRGDQLEARLMEIMP